MNKSLQRLNKIKQWPCGLWIFSKIICLWAPYFSTIKPVFTRLEPGFAQAKIKKRRAVQNHIGTVHAIAVANLCEFVAGTGLEISIAPTHRWIPKSMQINYVAKANTDLVATCQFPIDRWPDSAGFPIHVDVKDLNGQTVVTADIEMYVSLKKK